jgi:hypothetical protein
VVESAPALERPLKPFKWMLPMASWMMPNAGFEAF